MQPNFRLHGEFPIYLVLHEIEEQPELWLEFTERQSYPGTAHKDTECILIRGPEELTPESFFNGLEAKDYPASSKLPECVKLYKSVCKDLRASEIGRVMVVKLKPEGYVDRHSDEGLYAEHYQRFHLAIQSDKGNIFECGEDWVHMKPGECWWFNHRLPHDVYNGSLRDRIHLIFDVVLGA